MIYTAWAGIGDTHPTLLIEGYGPPEPWMVGTIDNSTPVCIWIIDSDSWEDAMTQYHKLQGWEPYKPLVIGDG